MRKFDSWINTQEKSKVDECKNIIGGTIRYIHRMAVTQAPVNKQKGHGGFLKQSIHMQMTDKGLGGMVYTGRNYAAFQEWGTGSNVQVPTFVKSMFGVDSMDWKGRGIRKVNLKPHPYLFENARVGYNDMINKLHAIGFK
jgi:hypothetical protein